MPPTQPPLARPPSQITLDLGPGALISFSAAPDQEISIAAGTLNALLDRPVDSGGQRIALQGPATFIRLHTATSITVDVGSVLTPAAKTSLALIAENALIPVGTPNGFLLSGTLSQGRISGGLSIGFPAAVIVPTFPDPYAAAYSASAGRELLTGVAALVTWTATAPPVLTINPIKASFAPAPQSTSNAAAPLSPDGSTAAVIAGAGFQLLDVSSNADQWGITIGTLGGTQFSFAGLQLQAPAAATTVYTVPGISWEPVVDTTGVPAWLSAFSPDDGTPTTFLVAVTTPTPIVPVLALEQYQAAAGTLATRAAFTLPFGITANLSEPTPASPGPSYAIPAVQFPDADLTGARVLSITGPQDTLPGTAITGFYATPPAYGAQVLGTALPSVANFWDDDFGPSGRGFMPIGRIDLSGYGTTLFSDWLDPVPTDPGIIRALFNVLLGRTAHEIITAQIWILPWCIRLQRTITFDRSDAGEVVKHDTGWQAVGPGFFELLAPNGLLLGAVESVKNVRNIQFSTAIVTRRIDSIHALHVRRRCRDLPGDQYRRGRADRYPQLGRNRDPGLRSGHDHQQRSDEAQPCASLGGRHYCADAATGPRQRQDPLHRQPRRQRPATIHHERFFVRRGACRGRNGQAANRAVRDASSAEGRPVERRQACQQRQHAAAGRFADAGATDARHLGRRQRADRRRDVRRRLLPAA